MASSLRSEIASILPKTSDAIVIFLLDGSGSVGKTLFDGPLKKAVLKLGFLVPKTYKAVVQFSTDVKTECSATRDYTIFEKSVNDMVFLNQGTDTAKGLDAVWKMLVTEQLRNMTKLVIVITDGCSSTKTEEAVNNLKAIKANIMCIGVGRGISYKKLHEMSTGNNLAINIDDYSMLFKALQNLEPSESGKIEPKVGVDLRPKTATMCFDEPLELVVNVQSTSKETIPEGAIVEFENSSFFFPNAVTIDKPIKKYQNWEGEITLKMRGGGTINEFPTDLDWECSDENTVYCRGTTSLGTGYLRGDFYYEKAPINVLVFGRKGSGKSSFINTALNSLIVGHTVVPNIAAAEDSPDHVTTMYTAYPLRYYMRNHKGQVEEGANRIPFVFYDLWGDSEEDFKGISISHFMKGMVKVKTKRVNDVVELDYDMVSSKSREIHAVVIVVTMAARNFPDKIARIKKTMQKVTALNMTPLVVVTMCDAFDTEEELDEAKEEMRQTLKASKMYFMVNYSSQAARDPKNIDFPARAILSDIFAEGKKTHVAREKDDVGYFSGVNWEDFTPISQNYRTPKKIGKKPGKRPGKRPSPTPGRQAGKRRKISFSVRVGDETLKYEMNGTCLLSEVIVKAMEIPTNQFSQYEILSADERVEFENSQTLQEAISKLEEPYSFVIYEKD